MPEFLYRYKFTMKPGTPCEASAGIRRSLRHQTITLLPTFSGVTSQQDKKIEAP